MRATLLVALALVLGGIVLGGAPTAAAACSTGHWVDDVCASTLCTVKKPTGPWIHTCWGIIGPPP